MHFLDFIPGTTKWLFLVAVAAFYGIGWVAWRVQNDCVSRGYGPVATTFWSVGTLFAFFPVFPLYLLMRDRMGIKSGAPATATGTPSVGEAAPMILCPHCGSENPAYLTSCLNCEQPLTPESEPHRGLGTVACPYCGTQNPVGALECSQCYQRL